MKKAIIMGASSGMGHELALQLLEKGWTLGLAARRQEPLEELADRYPGRVIKSQIDVTREDAADRLCQLFAAMRGADVYFHVAGIGFVNKQLDTATEMRTVGTNADGFVRCIDAVFHLFAEQGRGHIVAVSSIAGTKGLGPAPAYSATKALQATYLQALEQLAHSRRLPIRFTDIRPGFVATPLLGSDPAVYPLLMKPQRVVRHIIRAAESHRHICVIDFRWRVITALWRLVPNCLWRRLKLM